MVATNPRFVLVSETQPLTSGGQWRFLLTAIEGGRELAACDCEPDIEGERLELLSVVRGLEALDQPSRVTLLTGSDYVSRGLKHGLAEWRENGWRWERFGKLVPVNHLDLWQRIDRALSFHEVECRRLRIDQPHIEPESFDRPSPGADDNSPPQVRNFRPDRPREPVGRRFAMAMQSCRWRMAQAASSLFPRPRWG